MSTQRKLNIERQLNVEKLSSDHFSLFKTRGGKKSVEISVLGYEDANKMQESIFHGIEMIMIPVQQGEITLKQENELRNVITTLCRLGRSLTMRSESEGLDEVCNN